MNIGSLVLSTAILLSTTVSIADLKPIEAGSQASAAVSVAAAIVDVQRVKSGGMTYQFVSMDSALNGDLNLTTILLVGQEVGPSAGYDDAFQLTPNDEAMYMKTAKAARNGIEVIFGTFEGKKIKKQIKYDKVSRTLKGL